MLDELIAPLGIPAIANVPVGHGKHMATMPLWARDADRRRRQDAWRCWRRRWIHIGRLTEEECER